MIKLLLLLKTLRIYNKYFNHIKETGYTVKDIDFTIDKFGQHLHAEVIIKEDPAGIVDLNNDWRQKGR